jgi:hypothetical protein
VKENKVTEHTYMEEGAHHLTADEIIESLENQKRDREQEEAEKERQREKQAELSECKQKMESQWKESIGRLLKIMKQSVQDW